MISVMDPASLGLPSTLNTGMAHWSLKTRVVSLIHSLYIVMVHELAGGSTVYECGPRLDLCHISGLNFHLDNQRLRAGGSCHYVSFQEVLFPLAEVERMGCQS